MATGVSMTDISNLVSTFGTQGTSVKDNILNASVAILGSLGIKDGFIFNSLRNSAGDSAVATNDDVVKNVMDSYPGFSRSPIYQNGLQVIDASEDRQKVNATTFGNRYSEFYTPGEQGGGDMQSNPGDTSKAVLEIYDKNTIANTDLKQELVLGEMLHGMKADKEYAKLRQQFADSFDEKVTQENMSIFNKTAINGESDFAPSYKGETYSKMMERSGTDAFIRAYFLKNSEGRNEFLSRYSSKQKEVIKDIEKYLKTK